MSWDPKIGELVMFVAGTRVLSESKRVVFPVEGKFKRRNVSSNLIMTVIGGMDQHQLIDAMYADSLPAEWDPVGPAIQPYYWCLSTEGVIGVEKSALVPCSSRSGALNRA